MRPKELWGESEDTKAPQPKSDPIPAPASTSNQNHSLKPPAGIRSSPRRHRNPTSDTQIPQAEVSPRKRQKTVAKSLVMPSPRMATRASARTDEDDANGPDHNTGHENSNGNAKENGHASGNSGWDGHADDPFNFSNSPTPSPFVLPPNGQGTDTKNKDLQNDTQGENGGLTSEMDIGQLLAQYGPDQFTLMDNQFNLDALLAGIANGDHGVNAGGEMTNGDLLVHGPGEQDGGFMSQELMDFLAGMEGQMDMGTDMGTGMVGHELGSEIEQKM